MIERIFRRIGKRMMRNATVLALRQTPSLVRSLNFWFVAITCTLVNALLQPMLRIPAKWRNSRGHPISETTCAGSHSCSHYAASERHTQARTHSKQTLVWSDISVFIDTSPACERTNAKSHTAWHFQRWQSVSTCRWAEPSGCRSGPTGAVSLWGLIPREPYDHLRLSPRVVCLRPLHDEVLCLPRSPRPSRCTNVSVNTFRLGGTLNPSGVVYPFAGRSAYHDDAMRDPSHGEGFQVHGDLDP